MQSRKETIRNAAAQLFRKKGYNGTSMKEIAEAVGIRAASIYNHINSKQELLHDLLFSMAGLFVKGMKDINNAPLNAESKLERLIALHVRLTVENTDAVSLIAGEWVHLEEPNKTNYLKLRTDYENEFKEIIDKGKEEGQFIEIDTEIILFSTLSTLRWLYSWYSKNKNYNIMDLEKQMMLCLIGGIKK